LEKIDAIAALPQMLLKIKNLLLRQGPILPIWACRIAANVIENNGFGSLARALNSLLFRRVAAHVVGNKAIGN
jgi:hypothetical protein